MSKAIGFRRTPQGKKGQYFDEVVRLYYEEGLNGFEISKILPVHNSSIYRWLDEYELQYKGKETSMKKENKPTDIEKPRRVIGTTAPEINAEFISVSSEEESEVQPQKTPCTEDIDPLKKRILELERELQATRKTLKETKLKADLYNEIINVAEKKFNVQIRKKAGTRQ